MTIDLLNFLLTPNIAAMTDADATAAANVPTWVPRAAPITLTALSALPVWGFTKTAIFRAALVVASGNPDPTVSAPAATLLSILEGSGFSATDPQVAKMVPMFVALSGGAINAADGQLAIATPVYPADGPVATADVTAARAVLADYQKILAAKTQSQTLANQAQALSVAADAALANLLDGQPYTVPGGA